MKLLALHGGGMLGYMSLCYLEKLEEETGKTVPEMFDMIGGLSTGSIITAGYVAGFTTSQMRELYEELHSEIFTNKRNFFMQIFCPAYDLGRLEGVLKNHFGDKRISDSKIKALMYAVELNRGDELNTKFWKSWKDDELLYKIVCASSCAPPFFAPYKIDDLYFFDGGIATNNPSMCMVADAVRLGTDPKDIDLMSLWTYGISSYAKPSKLQGLYKIAVNSANLFVSSGADVVDYQASKLVNRFVIVKPDISLPIDTNDFDKMKKASLAEWKDKGPISKQIFGQ